MIKTKRLLNYGLFVTILLVAVISLPSKRVHAISSADWQAGRIIDDTVFTDADSMSVDQIQTFLNTQVPDCDINGTEPATDWGRPDLTHAQFATQVKGWPGPPYVCLKNYYEVPKTTPGAGMPDNSYNHYDAAGKQLLPVPGGVSAAQLIYNAAQQYHISPKVLLVKIKSESAGPLTNDPWPLQYQYTYAMGAHCPDNGPNHSANCDPNYAGFSIQISEAASLLRYYLDNMSQPWWPYKTPGINSILYNPDPACGSSNINITNSATAALYTYTPYQPNQATLDAGYGTAPCGAYGNRNFWLYFNNWFSTTYAPSYAWKVASQYAFTDDTKTKSIGLNNLVAGQRAFIGFTAVNTGNTTWTNSGTNPVDVGTLRPTDRPSQFYDSTWLGYGRPGRMKEASVAPGQTGTFEFWITAPQSSYGNFNEYFGLVVEGKAWMGDIGMYFAANVQPARYTWQLTSQYAFTDDTKTTATGLGNMEPGQRRYIGFTAKNTGNTTWTNSGTNPVDVGTLRPTDRPSQFYDSTWLGYGRPGRMKEASVAPGQTGTFEFWITAPQSSYGNFNEYFGLVVEGKAWMGDIGFNYASSVITPNYSWQLVSQYAYTDASKSAPSGLNLSPGQTAYIGFTARNTGNISWHSSGTNPLDIGTTMPSDRLSPFCSAGLGWLGCNRPVRMREVSVAPGQIATFEFLIKAPFTSGIYREYFSPVVEGSAWLPNIGFNYYIVVN